MFEVEVMFEGYSRVEEGGRVMHANCTWDELYKNRVFPEN